MNLFKMIALIVLTSTSIVALSNEVDGQFDHLKGQWSGTGTWSFSGDVNSPRTSPCTSASLEVSVEARTVRVAGHAICDEGSEFPIDIRFFDQRSPYSLSKSWREGDAHLSASLNYDLDEDTISFTKDESDDGVYENLRLRLERE